jgi:hypothetical protein
MRRHTTKFLVYGWRLLEVDARNPVRLTLAYRERYGTDVDFTAAVSGVHFLLGIGERGLLISKPPRIKLSGSMLAQAKTLISLRHGVEVRLAEPHETRRLPALRPPRIGDLAAVSFWPEALPERGEPVVVESMTAPGWYAAPISVPSGHHLPLTNDLDAALVFSDAESAMHWIAADAPHREFAIRFRAVALAAADQRETALLEDGL